MIDLNQSLEPLDSKKSANYISPKFQEALEKEEEEEEEEGGDQHSAQEYIACTAEEEAIKQCVLIKGNIASLLDILSDCPKSENNTLMTKNQSSI
jgi:hypothetical protein